MNVISKKILSKIKNMKNECLVNADIKHQGIKGGLNEIEFSKIIKDIIPSKYKISKGATENCGGEQSNETDCIIYDNEILPPYINEDLSMIPIESVKYNFEIKTKLTSKELETTISKFTRFKSIGGKSPTVLFSFSSDMKGSEIVRYQKKDENFLINPAISVICVSNKCYYYKHTEKKYLKDYFSKADLMKSIGDDTGISIDDTLKCIGDLLLNEEALSSLSRLQFASLIDKNIFLKTKIANIESSELKVNDINYDDITFKIHKWIGVECDNDDPDLVFFSGISNTLSIENFGNYLLNGRNINVKTFSLCCEDMWGNISCSEFNSDGIKGNLNEFTFNYQSSRDESKITFSLKRDMT